MENTTNLTDAEIFELESLFIAKFENLIFKPINQTENNCLIIENSEIEELVKFYYPGRYSKDENGNIKMSRSLFEVLQSRFFRNNQSVGLKSLTHTNSSDNGKRK